MVLEQESPDWCLYFFDKVGAVIDAGNYYETREENSTIPVIKIEER